MDNFLLGLNQKADREARSMLAERLINDFEDAFTNIGYFPVMFTWQVKEGSKVYQG